MAEAKAALPTPRGYRRSCVSSGPCPRPFHHDIYSATRTLHLCKHEHAPHVHRQRHIVVLHREGLQRRGHRRNHRVARELWDGKLSMASWLPELDWA